MAWNLDYVGPHLEPKYYGAGRTSSLAMSEPNFWNGIRSKKTNFSKLGRSLGIMHG
jgi:hypothetical protein